MTEMRLVLFGDGTNISRNSFHTQVVEGRSHPVLGLFLQECSQALKFEVARLSSLERPHIPAFDSIQELNDRIVCMSSHSGIQNALLCISQFCHYIK